MKHVAVAGIGAGCVTALAAGWYLVSPFAAVAGCRNAIVELNSERASACIDFPVLRESLKSELPAMLAKRMQKASEMRNSPFTRFGIAFIMPMVSAIVDAYVTPAGLSTAFSIAKSDQSGEGVYKENSDEIAVAKKSAELSELLQNSTLHYKGLDTIEVVGAHKGGPPIALVFNRQGFASWKLSSIRL